MLEKMTCQLKALNVKLSRLEDGHV